LVLTTRKKPSTKSPAPMVRIARIAERRPRHRLAAASVTKYFSARIR
jgi:hypothetical protein